MVQQSQAVKCCGVSLIGSCNRCAFGQAFWSIQVFQKVEDRLFLAFEAHWWIIAPSCCHVEGNAARQHCLSIEIFCDGTSQPIATLRKSLERAGGSMDAIVPRIWARLQSETFPIGVDQMACRL